MTRAQTLIQQRGTQMTLNILLNPSVEDIDESRLVDHILRLFGLFKSRHNAGVQVSTLDLMDFGKAQYNTRLYELRRALIKQGWCIDRVRRGENGVHYYELVPNEQSTFYKWLKEKGEV